MDGLTEPPCTCGPAATSLESGPDEACPWHGRAPYMACSLCNYDRHECGGCGAPLEHGQGACDDCAAELAEEQRRAREGV